jgi:hypothetical protein
MEDLFEQYETLPPEVQSIIEKYNLIELDKGMDYPDCKNFVAELEQVGYTCDYGLDAQPYDLKKL